jgi:hypothetical protein
MSRHTRRRPASPATQPPPAAVDGFRVTVDGFRVGRDVSLTKVTTVTGLPSFDES